MTAETKNIYIPERDYEANDWEPLGPPKEHFCVQCKKYYQNLYDKGITKEPFMPICKGDKRDLMPTAEELGVTQEEWEQAAVIHDPVLWAEVMFGFKARWYQKELSRCTSSRKVVRGGRRIGKTAVLAILVAHSGFTNDYHNILVVAPFQSQVTKIFEEISKLLAMNMDMKSSVHIRWSPPMEMKLQNGSIVKGFASGAYRGSNSDQIRGADAHEIYLDEMDFQNEYDLDTILAIMASHSEVKLWASSTPKGWRRKFWRFSRDKNLRFKEFHYISAESPEWTKETEEFLRLQHSDHAFRAEFLAEFGDEVLGVFRGEDIERALKDYDIKACTPGGTNIRVMGVDWNELYGTHICIVEHINTDGWEGFKLVDKVVVPKSEFTQVRGVEKVQELDEKWNPTHIYVDDGYGRTQVELLKIRGMQTPGSWLHEKVKPINMNKMIQIRDPWDQTITKKSSKQFMVEMASYHMQEGRIILPFAEDTQVVIEPDALDHPNVGLVQQMRDFSVERISASGAPVYSQGTEHTLIAWLLAILGFSLEHTSLGAGQFALDQVRFHSPADSEEREDRENSEKGPDSREANSFEGVFVPRRATFKSREGSIFTREGPTRVPERLKGLGRDPRARANHMNRIKKSPNQKRTWR